MNGLASKPAVGGVWLSVIKIPKSKSVPEQENQEEESVLYSLLVWLFSPWRYWERNLVSPLKTDGFQVRGEASNYTVPDPAAREKWIESS